MKNLKFALKDNQICQNLEFSDIKVFYDPKHLVGNFNRVDI